MKKFFRGDIYLCDLGQNKAEFGSEQCGIRPVVVIQNDIGNKYSPTVIVAAMTTKLEKIKYPTQMIVEPNLENGLKANSAIITEQIRTRDKRFFKDYWGRLSNDEMKKLNNILSVSIGLNDLEELDEIGKMVNYIRKTDMLLKNGIIKGHINNPFFQDVVKDREYQIKDLEIYCKNRDLDYKNFYNPYEDVVNSRSLNKIRIAG